MSLLKSDSLNHTDFSLIQHLDCLFHIFCFTNIFFRQVSKSEGSSLAAQHECAHFESSAAEEFDVVQSVFHAAIRDVIRERVSEMSVMQPSERSFGEGKVRMRVMQQSERSFGKGQVRMFVMQKSQMSFGKG